MAGEAAVLLFHLLVFVSSSASSLSIARGEVLDSHGIPEEGPSVSREVFRFDGDVAWIVQLSDLHISSYYPDRANDLKRFFAPALRAIRPSIVLITGDITDAKNKDRTTTRQEESEWIQYRNIMDSVIKESGMDKKLFFDIRGNHDKYGVPYVGDKLDFFSNYSISSQLNRLSTIQSVSLLGKDWLYVFLGIDDSMNVGLRGPSNLFGHPSDERIETLESELAYWHREPDALVTKIVFGHFPMSFTASSETGKRYESIFGRQAVSAYLCGHLHSKFSKQLWKLHSIESPSDSRLPRKSQQFWEWELGDWKESRLMRILAIDGGQISFVDIELLPSGQDNDDDFQTTILVMHPTDSRSMNGIDLHSHLTRNDISTLVFSTKPILNVTAKVFDSSRAFMLVEELPLHSTGHANSETVFRAKWDTNKYMNASAERFWLQVLVIDIYGRETASSLRPFSVEGKQARLPMTWLAHLVLNVRWETLYFVLLWSNIVFLIVLLALPKLLNLFMVQNATYQKWAMSVSISLPVGQKRNLFLPLWFLIEGSRNAKLWWAMVLYLLYLFKFPWFWGHATSENGPVGSMSMSGWTVQFSDMTIRKDGLGTPDIMTITLPFMYFIVSPLFLLIYSLAAERSAFFLHSSRKSICLKEPVYSKIDSEHADSMPSKPGKGMNAPQCKICKGWFRTALLLGCFISACIHFRVSSLISTTILLPVDLCLNLGSLCSMKLRCFLISLIAQPGSMDCIHGSLCCTSDSHGFVIQIVQMMDCTLDWAWLEYLLSSHGTILTGSGCLRKQYIE